MVDQSCRMSDKKNKDSRFMREKATPIGFEPTPCICGAGSNPCIGNPWGLILRMVEKELLRFGEIMVEGRQYPSLFFFG